MRDFLLPFILLKKTELGQRFRAGSEGSTEPLVSAQTITVLGLKSPEQTFTEVQRSGR